jgi:hypothetical protein
LAVEEEEEDVGGQKGAIVDTKQGKVPVENCTGPWTTYPNCRGKMDVRKPGFFCPGLFCPRFKEVILN